MVIFPLHSELQHFFLTSDILCEDLSHCDTTAEPALERELQVLSPSGTATEACTAACAPRGGHCCDPQKSPDTPGSPEGNTEGPGTASSEPLLPS